MVMRLNRHGNPMRPPLNINRLVMGCPISPRLTHSDARHHLPAVRAPVAYALERQSTDHHFQFWCDHLQTLWGWSRRFGSYNML